MNAVRTFLRSRPRTPSVLGSLTVRLVAAAIVISLLGASVTLGVAYQLVRSATIAQSQNDLRSTARVIAKAPPTERATLVRNLDRAHARSIRLLLITASGQQVPAHQTLPVPASAVRAVQQSGHVSEHIQVSATMYLLEGIKVPNGDAIIAIQDLSLVRNTSSRLFDRFLIAAAAGVVLAAALGAFAATRISRPLRRSATYAHALADGSRGLPAPPGTSITDVAAINTGLTALDTALRVSEGRQNEFLLSVSHEIRTPLTGIRGYADALADGLIRDQAVQDAGRTLAAETARVDAFVSDLLELARLQTDDFPIRMQPFDLAQLVADTIRAWTPTADRGGVRLQADAAVAPVTIRSDAMRVRQLLDGLLENSLRASPSDTTITVRIEEASHREGLGVRVTVTDEGPGLDPSDVTDAFERGVLANRYRNVRPVGTGLGLSIASRLTRRLGGTISTVPSSNGAVFVIDLPSS
jgi:two-component system, OmpR family, sensor kinase